MQALLAALLFGLNAPFAKLLLLDIPPIFMAAFLYLGAAIGMSAIWLAARKISKQRREASLAREDRIWIILMIILDILAPFLLMMGLTLTSAANASLLNNFEMVSTALIALLFFKESIGRRVWISMAIITAASMILSVNFNSISDLTLSPGSLLVLGACICWGLENNCTRNLSAKNPIQIVIIKGFGSGLGALLLAILSQARLQAKPVQVAGALGLGFVSFGLSIFFYVRAQRSLGAARTSMFYAAAPFIGALVSFIVLKEQPAVSFFVGAGLMVAGTVLAINEKHLHRHRHILQAHEHPHHHQDGHHDHDHQESVDPSAVHSHWHEHRPLEHEHKHNPDIHHRHSH